MRRNLPAIIGVLVFLIASVVASAALPANAAATDTSPATATATTTTAVYCSFGDQFYAFDPDADFTNEEVIYQGYLGLFGVGPGYQWCQVNTKFGAGFYEWALKGTSYCLTMDAAAAYKENLVTCAGKASQEWALVDPFGREDWGGIENGNTAAGYRYLYDNSTNDWAQALQGWDASIRWNWTLDGPFA